MDRERDNPYNQDPEEGFDWREIFVVACEMADVKVSERYSGWRDLFFF